jgi:glycosyltransferase involved in cell wall biosynthesis
MHYLLINHVPFGATDAPDRFRVGDLFLQDLCAQARAICEVGGTLVVATPLVRELNPMSGGSFNTVEINPQECGFQYEPIPRYQSLNQYRSVRNELRFTLRKLIDHAEVIQMDYGGHPFMLGQVAWDLAREKKRIWLFDGADPFPRLELEASKEPNLLKRFAKKFATKRKIAFCREAIRTGDLVFAHNAAVVERFKDVWSERCHAFDRSFVTDEILVAQPKTPGSGPLRLVCAGRQIRIKGTDHAIQAVAKLREMNVPVELDIMGDGDDLPAFKQLAADLKLTDIVHFTGTVPYGAPLFDEWAKADIMLVTNLTAEISRNVLLSLARGLPLVTYENPGTDALLRDNHAAVIVPKGNVKALANAIAELSRNRPKLVTLAENGLRLARVKTLDATHRMRAQLSSALVPSPSIVPGDPAVEGLG